MTKNGEDKEIDIPDLGTIRTYGEDIVAFLVSRGGKKKKIHSYDGLTLWEVTSVDPKMIRNEEYVRLNFDEIKKSQQYIIQRVCPPIYTVVVDNEFAFAELEDGHVCILLSHEKDKLENAIEEKGRSMLVSTWKQLVEILVAAKEDKCDSVAVVLGEGADKQDYMEMYKADSLLLVADSLKTPN
jgi:hypothetical protein